VGGKLPGQRHLERRERSPQAPCGKRGQHVRSLLPSHQGGEHAPATDPEQVCHDTGKLDIRVLQPCNDVMLGLTPGLDKGHAGARQVAPRVYGGGHNARSDQPMGQECGDPAGIRLVGLSVGPAAPLMRVPDEHLHRAGEDVRDGSPIRACALHRHHRAVLSTEPIEPRQQRRVGRRTLPYLLRHLAILGDPTETGREWRLMPVHATIDRVDHLHRASLQGLHGRVWIRDDGAPALNVELPRVIDNLFDSSRCREQDRPIHVRGVPRLTSHVLFPSAVPFVDWIAGRDVAYFIRRGRDGDLHERLI
jgi:hypothetical protein